MSEERWKLNNLDPSIFEMINKPILIFNPSGDILFVNSSVEMFFHHPAEELEKRKIFDFVDNKSQEILKNIILKSPILEFEKAKITFVVQGSNIQTISQIGYINHEISSSDSQSKIAIIIGELNEGEDGDFYLKSQRIIEDRELLKSLIEFNPFAIAIFDPKGYFLHANDAFYDLWEGEPSEDYTLFADQTLQAQRSIPKGLEEIKNGHPFQIPKILYNVKNFNKTLPSLEHWVSINIFTLFDDENSSRYPVLIYEDISKRVEAENALKAYHSQLELQIENRTKTLSDIIKLNPYGIAIFDNAGNLIETNNAFQKFLGFSLPESFSLYNSELIKQFGLEELRKQLFSGKVIEIPSITFNPHDLIKSYPDKNLSTKIVAFPTFVENEKLDRIVIMFEDFTVQKQTEAQLDFERKQLLSIFDSFPEFVYVYHPYRHEILYSNAKLKSISISLGNIKDIVSDFQTKIDPVMDNYFELDEIDRIPIRVEHFHTILRKHYLITVRTIKWDNRKVILVFAIDISDRMKYERELEEKLKFREIITEISTSFLVHFNFNQIIDESFQKICQYLHCEEISLFRGEPIQNFSEYQIFHPDLAKEIKFNESEEILQFQLTNFWFRFGIDDQMMENKSFTVKKSSAFYNILLEEKWITFRYSHDHPLYPNSFQRVFGEKSDLYSVFFPVKFRNKLIGLLLFRFKNPLINEEHHTFLKLFTDILGNALEREFTQVKLTKERITLENIIRANPYGIAIFNGKGEFESVNEALYQMLNSIPKSSYNLFKDKILARTNNLMKIDKLKQGSIVQIPLIKISKNEKSFFRSGEDFFIKFTAFPIISSERKIQNIVIMVENLTNEKVAKQALEDSQIRYQKLFENSSIGIAIVDFEGHIHEINKRMLEMLNCSENKIDQVDIRTLYYYPKDRDLTLHILQEKGKVENREIRIKNYTGDSYWALVNIQMIKNSNQTLLFVTQTDITEKKLAQQQLLETERKFQSLVESSNDLIWEIDEKGVIQYISPKCQEILGFSSEYFLGKNLDKINFVYETSNTVLNQYAQFLRKIEKEKSSQTNFENINLKVQHRNGKTIILETNGTAMVSENNKLLGFRGVSRDITIRKKVEERIKQSEVLYRNVVETSDDMIFIINISGKYLFLNSANEKTLGFNPKDLNKMNTFDLIHPEDSINLQKQLKKLEDGKVLKNIEYRFRTLSGKFLTFQTNFTPLKNSEGKIDSILGVARDITEIRKKERVLRNRELNLQYANVMSMVSSMLIHDTAGDRLNIGPILRTLGNSIHVDYIFALAKKKSFPSDSYSIMDTWQRKNNFETEITLLEPQISQYCEDLDLRERPLEIYQIIDICDFPSDVKSIMEHIGFQHILEVPIYQENELYGHILLVSLTEDFKFESHVVKLALNVAILIGFGLNRFNQSEIPLILFKSLDKLSLPVYLAEEFPSDKIKFLYLNNAFCEFFGYSKEEILQYHNYSPILSPMEHQLIKDREMNRDIGKNELKKYRIQVNTKYGRKTRLLTLSSLEIMNRHIVFGMLLEEDEK